MDKYNPNIHHRRSIRLKGYDYSQAGLYFVTICVQNWNCLFGEIVAGAPLVDDQNTNTQMILNDAGQMIESEWLKLAQRFKNIQLHAYVVMPNHFHAILEIVGANVGQTLVGQPHLGQPHLGQPQGVAPTDKTLGDMVGAFESITTVEYILGVRQNGWEQFDGQLWQRNYWEHIIRKDEAYQTISEYIVNNPAKWNEDELNPQNQELG